MTDLKENTTIPEEVASDVQQIAQVVGLDPKKPWLSRTFLIALGGFALTWAPQLGYHIDSDMLLQVLRVGMLAVGLIRAQGLDWSWLNRK